VPERGQVPDENGTERRRRVRTQADNPQEARMALSDQLENLATRTKHLEDTAKAADEKNRAKLEQ
jgi:hypothetical protein